MTKAQQFVKDNQFNQEFINGLFNISWSEWDSDMVEDICDLIIELGLIQNQEDAWKTAILLRDALRAGEINFDYDVRVVIKCS